MHKTTKIRFFCICTLDLLRKTIFFYILSITELRTNIEKVLFEFDASHPLNDIFEQKYKQTHKQTNKQKHKQTNKQSNKQSNKQTDKWKTNEQTNKHKNL